MPKITISKEAHERLAAFRKVIQIVQPDSPGGESLDAAAEMLMLVGVDFSLSAILGSQEATTLVQTLQQLGARHPDAVYGFVAEMLHRGDHAAIVSAQQRIGFRMPPNNAT